MKVLAFKNRDQILVDAMLKEIQLEFNEPFTSIASIKMKDAARMIHHRFWVLKEEEKLAGTIGMIKMKNHSVALKSLFVRKEYRSRGGAAILLKTFMDRAIKKNMRYIYLGTMDQMKAAQRFYEKNGFVKIDRGELPGDFPANILDTVFYCRETRV
jgi:N-acetylglutamate synthase-like GNAT family acetyltransferase